MFKLLPSRQTDTQGLCTSRLFDNDTFYKSFTNDLWSAQQRVSVWYCRGHHRLALANVSYQGQRRRSPSIRRALERRVIDTNQVWQIPHKTILLAGGAHAGLCSSQVSRELS
jgi:hypothetical protein